ncbi:BrnT family toxin (plasmid) [Agrobacterium rosae]|uniref:BrnT family toxin n=1 Tax=Agrobacterium rosae TaxID=1972867 RepID=A0AAW9FHQ1_9HYPH|nr:MULTISPECIES: BrnT family toxin [Agrobacterium]MDX8321688.1 BrnT family toxin [Agrobacterium sp. rho-8.1]MDX8305151.1 BrnT family toxin [Agrobacterium rosae]MDX8311434.1 BrnT family toxin [Agrobacterium sp. rho-13.3]MDX8316333.1 BrnT family toxin [Agrobacterium rosae]MDX8332360.1 BrnT family toxin [Agrobacterium rosae]
MEFEWDDEKREKVIEERGVDFVYAALIFEGPVVTSIDDRKNYGEIRLRSIGLVGDECFIVVHTRRDDVTRLITAWKGGRNDRIKYEESIT